MKWLHFTETWVQDTHPIIHSSLKNLVELEFKFPLAGSLGMLAWMKRTPELAFPPRPLSEQAPLATLHHPSSGGTTEPRSACLAPGHNYLIS